MAARSSGDTMYGAAPADERAGPGAVTGVGGIVDAATRGVGTPTEVETGITITARSWLEPKEGEITP
jgi:hypothetical protein